MTTHPDLPADADLDVAAVDDELVARCESSGEYLAGVLAAGLLDAVGQPEKLPELLWPDADPVLVQAVWERAFVTGYRTRRLVERPQWTREGLDRLRQALREAGYQGMGRLASRSLTLHPEKPAGHPADAEAGLGRPGGHGPISGMSDDKTDYSTRSATGGDTDATNW